MGPVSLQHSGFELSVLMRSTNQPVKTVVLFQFNRGLSLQMYHLEPVLKYWCGVWMMWTIISQGGSIGLH